MFKDASANKGGVTSSSLEVLAALVLTDDEFRSHMAVPKEACAAGRPADADVRVAHITIVSIPMKPFSSRGRPCMLDEAEPVRVLSLQ
jgi:hypothetical protein